MGQVNFYGTTHEALVLEMARMEREALTRINARLAALNRGELFHADVQSGTIAKGMGGNDHTG